MNPDDSHRSSHHLSPSHPHQHHHLRQKRSDSENRRPPSPAGVHRTLAPHSDSSPKTCPHTLCKALPLSGATRRCARAWLLLSCSPLAVKRWEALNRKRLAASDSPPERYRNKCPRSPWRLRNPALPPSLMRHTPEDATHHKGESNGFLPRTAERSCCHS